MQILLDAFDIKGIVHYGIAGSANDSLLIGDVSVPEYVAFTSSWEWTVQDKILNIRRKMNEENIEAS